MERARLRRRVLALVVLFGVIFRLYFFVGLVSGDPQDDGVYYLNALAISKDGPRYLERYRNLAPDFLANPIDQFNFRPMTTYPISLAFKVLGPGETAAVLWSLACSALSIPVVYGVAALLGGPSAGLLAAVLLAVYPLDVVLATRILSDGPLGFLCGLGILGVMTAESRVAGRRSVPAWLAGVAFGLAYLANPRALLVLGFVVVLVKIKGVPSDRGWHVPVPVLLGFGAVFFLEAATYFWTTGQPFLNLRIHNGANTFKYLNEPSSAWRLGLLDVHFTNGRPLQLLQTVFHLRQGPTDHVGLYFFLFAAGVADAVIRRRHLFIAVLGVGLFAFLEFGFVGVHWNASNRLLEYWMVFKQERFLAILTVPLIALAACSLARVAPRQPLAVAAVLVLLTASSVQAIEKTRTFYRAGLSDLRAIADDVLSQPRRTFHTDPWAETHLRLFTQHRADNLRSMNRDDAPYTEPDACIIVGGSRGIELLANYVESGMPAWARQLAALGQPPPDWQLIRSVSGPRTVQRRGDLRIYCRS